jgi:hypothetical protein
LRGFLKEIDGMATRERRLAEFNGEGEPPPDLPVQVLCEDQSGTYLLPFACRYIDGEWRPWWAGACTVPDLGPRPGHALCQNATVSSLNFKVQNADRTNRARISGRGLYCRVHG